MSVAMPSHGMSIRQGRSGTVNRANSDAPIAASDGTTSR